MREKLVFILRNPLLTLDDRTGQVLSLMREEIKKVRSENPYSADEDTDEFFAFDLACVKILRALESE